MSKVHAGHCTQGNTLTYNSMNRKTWELLAWKVNDRFENIDSKITTSPLDLWVMTSSHSLLNGVVNQSRSKLSCANVTSFKPIFCDTAQCKSTLRRQKASSSFPCFALYGILGGWKTLVSRSVTFQLPLNSIEMERNIKIISRWMSKFLPFSEAPLVLMVGILDDVLLYQKETSIIAVSLCTYHFYIHHPGSILHTFIRLRSLPR